MRMHNSFFCFLLLLAASSGVPAFAESWTTVVGSARGVHGIDAEGNAVPLWTDGEVRTLLHAGNQWLALGDKGITASADLVAWESRNAGLPVKVIKRFDDGRESFDRIVQELKDLEADPQDPRVLVTATKDTVFLSRDGGRIWKDLGTPVRTNGIKSVAVASLPRLTVFVSHAIYGVHYLEADKAGAKWVELNAGLEKLETTDNPDEVADIAVAASPIAGEPPRIWASQSFKPIVYRLDWANKTFRRLWSAAGEFGTIESLNPDGNLLRFVGREGITELAYPASDLNPLPTKPRADLAASAARAGKAIGSPALCLVSEKEGIELSELWMLGRSMPSAFGNPAAGRQGLYLPVNHAATSALLAPYLKTIESRALDMVVVDMKDDYGRLRFTPRDPSVAAKGRSFNPIDIEALVSTMKAKGVWLVARVVVFKDPELAKLKGGKFAVWDATTNRPWVGWYNAQKKKEPAAADALAGAGAPAGDLNEFELVPTNYDERWVDPYSEEVWDYIASLSNELIARGFDEIQFDYIRFPTDGQNLGDARYRWKDAGMDMESAILSFLSHVRSRVAAPISIDIYGANGWYRTGARTGQEVELLSRYVDVICPMYYPSHFEQGFLAGAPSELRPYRIYYRGTLRTDQIARGRVIVRPYVQAFYLNVAYDRKYYNLDYVRLQKDGVRDAGFPGLTYWNNGGRYDDIPLPDLPKTAEELERAEHDRRLD